MSGYDRLAPFIREFIWQSGWTALRDVQEAAIDAILGEEGHVLIAAGTASGKTEAAFFPILTRLLERPGAGFGALYVGPLKALINDQFERIDALLDEADIPLFAWHGDRAESEKKRARTQARGVLQITPEALEGLLMRHQAEAARMLAGLQFIIIDELHAFMGTDRGLQLQCQLNRIDRLIGHGVRRVGLSATIADYTAARAWLAAGTALETTLVESAATGRRLDLALQNYLLRGDADRAQTPATGAAAEAEPPQADEEDLPADAPGALPEEASPAEPEAEGAGGDPAPAAIAAEAPSNGSAGESDTPAGAGDPPIEEYPAEPEAEQVDTAPAPEGGAAEPPANTDGTAGPEVVPAPTGADLYADLYRLVRGKRCLVFTNSRAETEAVVTALREEAARRGEPDVFHAHHGSLSAAIRHDAEAAMKEAEGPAVAVATRTLELGIDLGKLDRVVQLGAADSCAGFVQRLGRTGRRGQPAVMRFLTREKPRGKSAFDDLPWEMLRTIAVLQLYLEERWVEPFEDKPLPYSLLFQQIISALMPGELSPRALAKQVHTLPAFRQIPVEDYMLLLRHMLETDMVTKLETGTLLPGMAGERLGADYQFLSVFQDSGGYRVVCGSREIGSLDTPPADGESVMLAGSVWRVTGVDREKRVVYVNPGSGSADAAWQSGGAGTHDRIVAKMRDILTGEADYAYLHPAAKQSLARARAVAAHHDLHHLFTLTGGGLLLHPWLGSRKTETLAWLLRGAWSNALAIQTVKPIGSRTALLVDTLLPRKVFLKQLKSCAERLEPEPLVATAPAMPQDRNDLYLPEELRRKAYVYNVLDIPGLRAALLAHPDLADIESAEPGAGDATQGAPDTAAPLPEAAIHGEQ